MNLNPTQGARPTRFFALVLVLLVCTPIWSDTIEIPVNGRPGGNPPPWPDATTALVDAAVGNNPNFPPGGTTAVWMGVNFARHHVIPQTYLQVIANLAANPRAGDTQGKLRYRLVGAIKTIAKNGRINGPDAGGPPAVWNMGVVIWSRVNLFIGPTGYYRSDDPGEMPETKRPGSFDLEGWNYLQAVINAFQNCGVFVDGRDGKVFQTSTDILNSAANGKTNFEKLVNTMEAMAAYTKKKFRDPLSLSVSDWMDQAKNDFRVSDLLAYQNSRIVVNTTSVAKKGAYRVK